MANNLESIQEIGKYISISSGVVLSGIIVDNVMNHYNVPDYTRGFLICATMVATSLGIIGTKYYMFNKKKTKKDIEKTTNRRDFFIEDPSRRNYGRNLFGEDNNTRN
jgi:hypothetical protein